MVCTLRIIVIVAVVLYIKNICRLTSNEKAQCSQRWARYKVAVSHFLHSIHVELHHQSNEGLKNWFRELETWQLDQVNCYKTKERTLINFNIPGHQVVKQVWLRAPTIDLPEHTEEHLTFCQILEDFGPLVQQPTSKVFASTGGHLAKYGMTQNIQTTCIWLSEGIFFMKRTLDPKSPIWALLLLQDEKSLVTAISGPSVSYFQEFKQESEVQRLKKWC